MKDNCLDIGILQAFMDCELSQAESIRVSGHVADCSTCALLLAQAEDEAAVVFPALEREFNTLVPTQRLWSKINESIITERESQPSWKKALAFLAVTFANPSLAAAASLLVVAGIFTIVWVNRSVVSDIGPVAPVSVSSVASREIVPIVSSSIPASGDQKKTATAPEPVAQIERAVYRPPVRQSDSQPRGLH